MIRVTFLSDKLSAQNYSKLKKVDSSRRTIYIQSKIIWILESCVWICTFYFSPSYFSRSYFTTSTSSPVLNTNYYYLNSPFSKAVPITTRSAPALYAFLSCVAFRIPPPTISGIFKSLFTSAITFSETGIKAPLPASR